MKQLEEILNYNFKDKSLLKQALIHGSYTNENSSVPNNEVFEFLGDAVLQLVITEYLIESFNKYDEGKLSKLRAYIVSKDFLSSMAKKKGLDKYLILGKAQCVRGINKSILCDTFEAIFGAIHKDGGYIEAKKSMLNLLKNELPSCIESTLARDSKSTLQGICLARYSTLPSYVVLKEEGPDHQKEFTVSVRIGDRIVATGVGLSKKDAQKSAAAQAVSILENE